MNLLKKKNFKGETLIEVIVAFAVVAIIGVITVTGVIASGRIKLQTAYLKEASLEADENLQSNGIQSTSSDDIKFKILDDENNIVVGSQTAYRSEGDATVKGKSISYKYYDAEVHSTVTPSVSDTGTVAVNSGGCFGLAGRWGVRFYIDDEVSKKVGNDFYIEIKISGAYVGTTYGSSGGVVGDNNYCARIGAYTDWSWLGENLYYNFEGGSQNVCMVAQPEVHNNIFYKTSSSNTFGDSGQLSLVYHFDFTSASFNILSVPYIDIEFGSASFSSYQIQLNIMKQDNTSNSSIKDENGNKYVYLLNNSNENPVYKVVVFGRGNYNNWGYDWNSQYSNGGPKGYMLTGVNSNKEHVTTVEENKTAHTIRESVPDDYMYYAERDADGTLHEYWNEDFVKKNILALLGFKVDGKVTQSAYNDWNNLNEQSEVSFREYLRSYDVPYYTKYSQYKLVNGYSSSEYAENLVAKSTVYSRMSYCYWAYYILDVFDIDSYSTYGAKISDLTGVYGATNFKDFVNTIVNSSGKAVVDVAPVTYWQIYDTDFLQKAKDVITSCGKDPLNYEDNDVISLYKILWNLYYDKAGFEESINTKLFSDSEIADKIYVYFYLYKSEYLTELTNITTSKSLSQLDFLSTTAAKNRSVTAAYMAEWMVYMFNNNKTVTYTTSSINDSYECIPEVLMAAAKTNHWNWAGNDNCRIDDWLRMVYKTDTWQNREKKKNTFINTQTYTDTDKEKLNNIYNTCADNDYGIDEAANYYNNSGYSNYDLGREFLICLYAPTEYEDLYNWLASSEVCGPTEMSDPNRNRNDSVKSDGKIAYSQAISVAWKYYCLDIAGTRDKINIYPESYGWVASGSITSFADYYEAYKGHTTDAAYTAVMSLGQMIEEKASKAED